MRVYTTGNIKAFGIVVSNIRDVTSVNTALLRSLKILCGQQGMRLNQLLEEAMHDYLKKHEKKLKNNL